MGITKTKHAEADETKNTIFNSFSVVRSKDEKPLHYTLKIQSFSMLKTAVASSKNQRFESHTFSAGGYKWKLALYPNGDETRNGSNYISLYLVTAEDNILSTTSEVNAVFTFLVYDTLRDKYLAIQDGKMRRFSAMKTEWGFENLISLDTLKDASKGFLVDDCCVFGVDIFVMNCKGKGGGEVFSLIKQPENYKYTWKINKFSWRSPMNFIESDPFTVESYRWKLWLYPKGCSQAMPGFLSLYLVLDSMKELPQSSRVYVEYELAVLSQLGVQPKKVACRCWFGVDGVKGAAGCPNIISLRDLQEPTKGFTLDDTLIVEVKIDVLSTSKFIS